MQAITDLLLAFAVCTTPIALQGQAPTKSDQTKHILTTIDMRRIASDEFTKANEELNQVYKTLLSRLDDGGQKAKLRTAQKAWLKYRDANADFEAFLYEGGSIKPQIYTYSLVTMTQNRTKELQAILTENFDR